MNAEDDREDKAEEASPGAVLAAAREAEKLSIAEVARHLKLSVAQVGALETGDFDRLPGRVFVRGFVRNYARLVKVDPEALLRLVEPELGPSPPSHETPLSKDIPFPPRPPRRWPLFALLALLVVGVLAVHEFYWLEPLPAPPGLTAPTPMTPMPAPEAPQAVNHEPVAASPAAMPVMADPGEPAPSPAPQPAAVGPEDALQASAPVSAVPAQVPEAPPPAPAGSGVVQMSFEDESWVEIRDRSGNVIFSQLNPAGTQKRVNGEPPLSLVIGNAHGVRVTYNDRPVDIESHTKVDVARFVLE